MEILQLFNEFREEENKITRKREREREFSTRRERGKRERDAVY